VAGIKVSPPPRNVPFVDVRTGLPTKAFSDFLYALWERSGGTDDGADFILKLMMSGGGGFGQGQTVQQNDENTQQNYTFESGGASPAEIDEKAGNVAALLHALAGAKADQQAREAAGQANIMALMGGGGAIAGEALRLAERARVLVKTAPGGNTTEDGANTWANLITFRAPLRRNTGIFVYLMTSAESYAAPVAMIIVRIRNGTSDINNTYTTIQVVHLYDPEGISFNSFYLVAATDALNVDIKLWMQKPLINQQFALHELGALGDPELTYQVHHAAPWQSTDPTTSGSPAFVAQSDWAGSGQLTSTSLSNGWAGTAYYEKDTMGNVIMYIDVSTVGTTTDGTTIYTSPAGYRPGTGIQIGATYLLGAGSNGYFVLDDTGAVKCYGLGGSPAASLTDDFIFRARN
jgi:hypothetical protein